MAFSWHLPGVLLGQRPVLPLVRLHLVPPRHELHQAGDPTAAGAGDDESVALTFVHLATRAGPTHGNMGTSMDFTLW